jgi:hypothetical protein
MAQRGGSSAVGQGAAHGRARRRGSVASSKIRSRIGRRGGEPRGRLGGCERSATGQCRGGAVAMRSAMVRCKGKLSDQPECDSQGAPQPWRGWGPTLVGRGALVPVGKGYSQSEVVIWYTYRKISDPSNFFLKWSLVFCSEHGPSSEAK